MSVSQIQICNSAILKVGGDRISSITQDVRAAVLCNTLYDGMRDHVLRDHPWHFATTRIILSPNATVPAYEWSYTYDIPNDCLRILNTYPDDIEFKEEGGTLLSDESTLSVRYVYRNEDESSWPQDFAEAFAWKLASEISYPLTQSLALTQYCLAEYKKVLAEARSIGSMVGSVQGFEADLWVGSRR